MLCGTARLGAVATWRASQPRALPARLRVIPHVFLAPEAVHVGRLRRLEEEVLRALRGRAVWTLDTAARLACGRGLLAARGLTGYMSLEGPQLAVDQGLI